MSSGGAWIGGTVVSNDAEETGDMEAMLEYLCTRTLDHAAFPRLYVDATYVKRRDSGALWFEAIVAVTGARRDGTTEILTVDVGDSEDEAFWRRIFETMQVRGLRDIDEVLTGEGHTGLESAVARVFPGARVVVSNDYPVIDLRSALLAPEPVPPPGRPSGSGPDRPPGSRARWPNEPSREGVGVPIVGDLHEASAPGV